MNNVVRAPPAPAHVAEPTPKPTDKPAVDLPAATVIAPAAAAGAGVAGVAAAVVGSKARDNETVVPQGSGARPEDISARKQEVSKGAPALSAWSHSWSIRSADAACPTDSHR
jgi:hypothetical protein